MNIKYLLFFITLLPINLCYAKNYQEMNKLIEIAEEYARNWLIADLGTEADLEIKPMSIDSRVRLEQCSTLPVASIESSYHRQKTCLVKITCQAPHKWTIRIPLHITQLAGVVVTKNRINKDDIVTPQDITISQKDLTQITHSYFDKIQDVIGQSAKNDIPLGVTLRPHMIKQPLLIKRGDKVKILVKAPGLQIESQGIAQKEGIKNESITVKNSRSNKIIEAVVQEAGVVTIVL